MRLYKSRDRRIIKVESPVLENSMYTSINWLTASKDLKLSSLRVFCFSMNCIIWSKTRNPLWLETVYPALIVLDSISPSVFKGLQFGVSLLPNLCNNDFCEERFFSYIKQSMNLKKRLLISYFQIPDWLQVYLRSSR